MNLRCAIGLNPLMGFVGTVLSFIGFGFGLPVGLLIGYFFFVYSKPELFVQVPIVRPFHELDSKTVQMLLPDIPSWVKSPDYERVDWLNKIILDMWPYLDKAICNTIRSVAKPIFGEYIGKYHIGAIDFDYLTLGSLPPTFNGVKVLESQEKVLVIEPVIKWASNCNITMSVKLSSFKITFQVLDLQIAMSPRVTFKPLVPNFPCFANVNVCLMEKPQVDFGLKMLGGDLMAIPVLYRFVQDTVAVQIANLYHWPKVMEIPILDNASGVTRKPVGILHVKVLHAINLLKMDFLGKSDPYVKLSLSGERLPSKKTSVIMSNLNPVWNEHFKLIVKDPETQVLQLHVFDWEKVKAHDKLGMQVIPLSTLKPSEPKEFTLNLLKNLNPNDPQNKRNRGQIVVELTFSLFKEDSGKFSDIVDGEEGYSGNASIIRREAAEDYTSSCGGGVLSVTVESAENVEGKRHNNTYTIIFFKGETKRTKVVKKSRNPRWNEEFTFMLEEAPINEKILIQVMSKRKGFNCFPKENLGHVNINLSDVVNNGRINETYHLINSQNGVINIEIEWSTI